MDIRVQRPPWDRRMAFPPSGKVHVTKPQRRKQAIGSRKDAARKAWARRHKKSFQEIERMAKETPSVVPFIACVAARIGRMEKKWGLKPDMSDRRVRASIRWHTAQAKKEFRTWAAGADKVTIDVLLKIFRIMTSTLKDA